MLLACGEGTLHAPFFSGVASDVIGFSVGGVYATGLRGGYFTRSFFADTLMVSWVLSAMVCEMSGSESVIDVPSGCRGRASTFACSFSLACMTESSHSF